MAGATAIRVRAGLRAKLGRLIGGSPYRGRATTTPYRGSLQGVAVDSAGSVYVKMMSDVGSHGNSGLWPWQLRKFDARGEYVKTLLPYPPSTAADMAHGVAKLIDQGCPGVLLTERGSFFGYRDLVVDYRSIKVMRDLGCPVVFDATHSVQQPGGQGLTSGRSASGD